jgi:glutamate synthase (ferredoxin)
MSTNGLPAKQGLYDPQFEHDACGVGFVCHMKGKKSHQIVADALTILENLDHRGACCEENTGDGAGILIQTPHTFLKKAAAQIGLTLPEAGHYGVANLYCSPDPKARAEAQALFEKICLDEGCPVLGWRDMPTDNSTLGKSAKASEPFMRQVYVQRSAQLKDIPAFEPDPHAENRCLLVRAKPFLPHAGLQRHAHAGPGRQLLQ